MTIPRANGERTWPRLAAGGKNSRQLHRWNHFELRVGALLRRFVEPPSPELRHVTETSALHVLVGNFDDQFGAQRLPRKVLALAPAALAARHSMSAGALDVGPQLPGVIHERVFSIWGEEFDQLTAFLPREA